MGYRLWHLHEKWKSKAAGMLVVFMLGTVFAVGPLSYRAAAAENVNLLVNGGYEMTSGSLPSNWSTWTSSGAPVFSVDESIYKEGQRSFRIFAETPSRGTLAQVIPLQSSQKGKTYKLRQWIRTENVTGAGAFNRMFLTGSTGSRMGDLIELQKLTGTHDWTLIEGNIMVPDNEEVKGIKVENFFETGTGKAWFDEAVLAPVETAANKVVNGGFEDWSSNGLPVSWGKWVPLGNPTIEADHSFFHSGMSSLKIESQETGRAAITQSLPLSASELGQSFKVGAWVKTQNVTGSALTRLQYMNSSGSRVGDLVVIGELNGTKDWSKLEKVIRIPDNPAVISVKVEHFFEPGTGIAWFDDVAFLPWIPLEAIALSTNELYMEANESAIITVSPLPANASDASVTWSSSNPAVAAVQEDVVTAYSDGLAILTATSAESGYKADVVVIVGGMDTIVAEDVWASIDQNGSASGQVIASSAIEAELNYWMVSQPSNGIAHVSSSGEWTYYPKSNYAGTDRFLVAIEDGEGGFAISRIELLINAINSVPVVGEGIYPTDKNTSISSAVAATDRDGDLLSYTLAEGPLHGVTSLQPDGNWTYTPNTNYTGADKFNVSVSDGNGGMANAWIRTYVAPTSEEIIDSLKSANPQNQHPRLLATGEDFQRMSALIGTDERFTEWFTQAKEEADVILTLPVRDYQKPDGLRLDTESANRIIALAFAYRLTGDAAYADRAWQELEHVSGNAYPDWSPQHYLDTASMTYGVAIGYDWLYDYFTQSQRDVIRQAIVDKGLTPAVPMYIHKTYWWVYNRDNWNFVCNAGMALGALAIADEEEELAGLILREAFKSIQYGLTQYAPDGSAKEGPSYWEYGTRFLVYFLAALDSAFGEDFGLSEREGLAETPLYPIHIAGPTGTFNYFDNSESLIPGGTLLWFANHDNKPEYTWYHEYATERGSRTGIYDMLWYRPELYGASPPQELDRKLEIPRAVTMRSNWDDPNALFAGFKGGVNGAPHGDLDTGTFVFDANGVRWALDIGKEDYNLPGYWDMSETGGRWTYYRKRAEGHNTLLISPSSGPDQDVSSISPITDVHFNETGGAYAIADLTPAYHNSAASVRRGVALIDERRQFLVQDEIVAKVPSDVLWFMHTRAAIAIGADGTSALLSQDGRQLWVKIVSPAEASFTIMDAEPLPTSPNPSGQTLNYGVKKLTIQRNDLVNETISVWMVPLMPGETPPQELPVVVPLQEWSVENGELASLSGLTIDGLPLESFNPGRFLYELSIPDGQSSAPVVHAEAGQYDVSIQQADGVPGMARIEVNDPSGVKKRTVYYVVMKHPVSYGIPSNRPIWQPLSVSASEHDGNVPENTLDGHFSTRWSAAGEQWIQYDLGESKTIGAVSIAFYNGDTRTGFFKIESSNDGVVWEQIYDGASSGESKDHELFSFPETEGRYVRITGFGNNQNQWNSITEVKIYGSPVAPVLNEVWLQCDCNGIKRKDTATLNIVLKLSNGGAIDSSAAEIRYFSTDEKVAKVVNGVVHTQKTGEADIWVEATYQGVTVVSQPMRVKVVKKNGHGSD